MKTFRNLILVAFAIITLSSCGYNSMVSKSEAVEGQWAQVENVYQRRADLIPNLVNTVKGYADFEKSTLTEVIELEGTENRISVERKKFNEATGDYNTYIKQFPRNIYSGWFDFEKKGYFEADAGAEKVPEVQF